MTRASQHPSGAKVLLTTKIPPAHREGFVAYARRKHGGNLSAAMADLIERAKLVSDENIAREESPTTPAATEAACRHPLSRSKAFGGAGLRQCGVCDYVGGRSAFESGDGM